MTIIILFRALQRLFVSLENTSSLNEKRQLIQQFKSEHGEHSKDLDYCLEVLAGKHKLGYTLTIRDTDEPDHSAMSSIEEFCKPLFTPESFSAYDIYKVSKRFNGFGWFLNPLFNREWRLGIGPSVLEKTDISPMLAKKYDPDKVPPDTKYFLTEKLDGNRCIARYDIDTSTWKFFSRSGKQLKVDFDMGNLPTEYIYDGEILSKDQIDNPSQENFNKLSGAINAKTSDKTRLIYMIFDLMLDLPYFERSALIRGLCAFRLMNPTSANVRILPLLCECTPDNLNTQVESYLNNITSRGGEGVMINAGHASYQHKRTDKLLKVKNVYTMDMVVKSVIPGTGKYTGVVGSLECVCGSPTGDVEYHCFVGSGLSDYERGIWAIHPERIVGKLVEVAYFSTSQDSTSRGTRLYSLRFPRFKRVRNDKSEPSFD